MTLPIIVIFVSLVITAFGSGISAGLSDLEKFSPYYKENNQDTSILKENIKTRLNNLKKSGICILLADDDNPAEVMDRIPENFPYIIIYPSQTDAEVERLVSYGESMWEGWCEYHKGREVLKWDDIKPKSKEDECRWAAEKYSLDRDYEGNFSEHRTIINKWEAMLEPEKPKQVKLSLGFLPE